MSDIIKLLPDAIANQIAAGEVVQRPASVVKELMENAIDAKANKIQLIFKDGGKTLIQVIDDGIGMSETDARMCFERHATSKIKKADDLFSLATLGFRGEAMASIAAVAQVSLKTRQHENDLGTHIDVYGSEVKRQEICQCPPGTNTSVKNLFYNVPARRNFLKSIPVETRHIVDVFQRIVLANPKISFSLVNNGIEIFQLPPTNLRKRIVGLLGSNYNERLVPVQEDMNFIRIYGFIGKPEFARKTRGEQFFFANERFIKSNYLNHAVVTAYEQLIPPKHHPLYVLFIDIEPQRIDVNVHPTKTEIKFDDEKVIYTFVNAAVRRALSANSITPTIDFDHNINFDYVPPMPKLKDINKNTEQVPPTTNTGSNTKQTQHTNSHTSKQDNTDHYYQHKKPSIPNNWEELYKTNDLIIDKQDNAENDATNSPDNNGTTTITLQSKINNNSRLHFEKEGDQLPPYQVHKQYILSAIKSGFVLIDQQAAHERILFEKYIKALANRNVVSQQLLFPQTIQLNRVDAEILKELLPTINNLGYDLQLFGQNSFVLQGVPTDLNQTGNEQKLIEELLEQYKLNVGQLKDSKQKYIAMIMARNNAVKKGQRLSIKEMQALTNELFACETPQISPKGYPTYVLYSLDAIEKQFKTKN